MRGSWRLGKLFGIDVRIHFTFVLLLAVLAGAHLWSGGPAAMASGVLFTVAVFGSVLLHEFGHALAARRFGVATRDITLLPIGGVAQLEGMPQRPIAEGVIALAGPVVNVVIALALGVWVFVTSAYAPLETLGLTTGPFAERLLAANLGLAVFNLVPAFPLDGGRILRALLAWKMGYLPATRIAARIGRGLAVVFAVTGLLINPMLVLIAAFVWFAAGAERSAAELQGSLGQERVGQLASTETLPTLDPGTRLGEAASLFLGARAAALPVAEGGHLVGAVLRDDLVAALARVGPSAMVAALPLVALPTVDAQSPLTQALPEIGVSGLALVRDERGALVGLVSTEQILLYAALAQAVRDFEARRPAVTFPESATART